MSFMKFYSIFIDYSPLIIMFSVVMDWKSFPKMNLAENEVNCLSVI